VGGALDFSTPPQVARRELLPHLPNGQQVVLRNLGHTEDFWSYQEAASTQLVKTFLDTGRVDTSRYTENRLDLTPSFTQSDLAKIVVGVLLGFAALALLGLAWLVSRLLRGKTFGRKGSAVARSLLPFGLGLAGWFTGVLVVLIAFATVPLTSAVLAIVSIAPLVALAVYAGWYRPAAHGTVAALVTLGGALVGAWLGFNVPETVALGPATAIVGAILAANLALIALDLLAPATVAAREPEAPQARTLPAQGS
jgi:hypothetical protein